MDVFWKNLVYSVRMLLKRPSLTVVAIIAIGLGIGANTAIFSVVNTVLLQPLPYDHPERLLLLASEQRDQALDGRGTFSVPDFLDVQKSSTTLEYVAMFQGSGTIMTDGGGDPERLRGAAVTADYFPLLGVKPVLGRVFTRDEDKPGAQDVILLSHGLWQRRFGGDPNIIGREINLGGKTTVIGIMPPGFQYPIRDEAQDFWEPMFPAQWLTKEAREERADRSMSDSVRPCSARYPLSSSSLVSISSGSMYRGCHPSAAAATRLSTPVLLPPHHSGIEGLRAGLG